MLTWVCSYTTIRYFGWNIFIFSPKVRDQPWRCTYFGAKLAYMAEIFLKKYAWCMKIHFRLHFFTIWSTSAYILYIITWKAPAISWSPSELAIFLKIYPRCFGQFSGSQDIKKIFCRRPCVSRLSFDSFDHGFSSLKALRQIWDILQGANSLRAKFIRKNLA